MSQLAPSLSICFSENLASNDGPPKTLRSRRGAIERFRSKIYCSVYPAELYSSECWPTIVDNERCLAVMETSL